MSENERFARNQEQEGSADESERIVMARDDEGPDVEGHRLVMANPAEDAGRAFGETEHRVQ